MAFPAFFTRDGAAFVPGPHGRGPWAPDMMHGRLLGGLLARTVEDEHGDDAMLPARLVVDLFRSPPLAPVEVETELVRDGRRIRVVDAVATIDGTAVARASVVMLRKTEQPTGRVWSPPEWSVPLPDDIEPPPERGEGWAPPWDTRTVGELGFGTYGQKRMWVRENRELVEGEPLTPFVRVAVAADYTSPIANSGDAGLGWINADISVYLSRLPDGDWIGFEVSGHRSAEGVAFGTCTLYDTSGAIGHSVVCALAQQRRA